MRNLSSKRFHVSRVSNKVLEQLSVDEHRQAVCSHHFEISAGIIRRASGGELPPDDWFARQAVYRVSMGNFVSFDM